MSGKTARMSRPVLAFAGASAAIVVLSSQASSIADGRPGRDLSDAEAWAIVGGVTPQEVGPPGDPTSPAEEIGRCYVLENCKAQGSCNSGGPNATPCDDREVFEPNGMNREGCDIKKNSDTEFVCDAPGFIFCRSRAGCMVRENGSCGRDLDDYSTNDIGSVAPDDCNAELH